MTDHKELAQQLAELLPCPFCGGKATLGNSGSTVGLSNPPGNVRV